MPGSPGQRGPLGGHLREAAGMRPSPMLKAVKPNLSALWEFGPRARWPWRSDPVAGLPGLDVLVELAGEVQALENEFERGGDARRVLRAEFLHGSLQRPHRADLATVLGRRHRVGHGDREP